MPGPCIRARARAHVCTKRTANASSPSPSPPNNRRGLFIPLLHHKFQDLFSCTYNIPRRTVKLYLASSQHLRLLLYGFGTCRSTLHCPTPLLQYTNNLQQAPNQPRPYPGNYLPNGGAPSGPVPGAVPLLPNQGRVLQQGSVRVLCIADVRGKGFSMYTSVGSWTDLV